MKIIALLSVLGSITSARELRGSSESPGQRELVTIDNINVLRNHGNGKVLDIMLADSKIDVPNYTKVIASEDQSCVAEHKKQWELFSDPFHPGQFQIKSKRDSRKCMSLQVNTCAAGTGVVMYDCVNVPFHRWKIESDGTVINSGCNLPIAEGADGSIILAIDENTPAFKWSLQPPMCTSNVIKNQGNGKVLDIIPPVASAGIPNFSNVVAANDLTCIAESNQDWIIENLASYPGKVQIKSKKDSNKCLSLRINNCSAGTAIVMYDCVDVSYHHWNIQNDGTIINAGCGLPIAEAADGSIILANNENTYVFKWSLKPTEVCLPKCNLESVFADESMTVNDQITLLANHFEARPEVKSLEQLIKQGGTNLEEAINKACFNLVLETKEGKAASCLARFIDSTISIGISRSVGLRFTTVEAGLSLIWGEGGQGACSLSTSAGFASKSIAGVGASASASISPAFLGFGGWDSVGSPVTHPELCLSVGWDIPATPASIAATVSVDLTKIQSPETAIANIKEAFTLSKDFFTKDRLKEKTFQGAVKEIGTEVELMASFLRNGNLNALGITSVGVDVGVGFDLFWEYADIKTAWLLPEVSVTACIEYVMACKGTGCDEKLQQLDDATPCLEGITCQLCKNRATWWYGYKACGKRPEKVIENRANGKVFDVENGFPLTNGRRVIAYPNSGDHINSVQGWVRGPDYLNNREDPYSTIRVASKHLVDFCLDLDNGICSAGTKVQIWDCHHGIEQNQQWYQSPDGTIYSKKCGAGLVLAEAADGAIILAGNEHTDAMKWSQVPL